MRIVTASPPKSGNNWIRCLLMQLYDLTWLPLKDQAGTDPETVRAWAAQGGFPDGSIYGQHCRYSKELCDVLDAIPARLVTIVRNPYDVFVSLYFWVQNRAAHNHGRGRQRPRDVLVGKPLDHPDVLAYLATEFGSNPARALGWVQSGRSVVVRYEGLHADPIGELTRATAQIEQVPVERIERAIEACRVEHMRQRKEKMTWHVRAAEVGDSRERLGEAHLAIFRERHAEVIRALGYQVR